MTKSKVLMGMLLILVPVYAEWLPYYGQSNATLTGLTPTNEKGFAFVCTDEDIVYNPFVSISYGLYFLQTDSVGNLITNNFPYGYQCYPGGILQTRDSGFLVVALTVSDYIPDLMKINKNGVFEWLKEPVTTSANPPVYNYGYINSYDTNLIALGIEDSVLTLSKVSQSQPCPVKPVDGCLIERQLHWSGTQRT